MLYTAKNCQLVVMSLKPGEEIGNEVHHLDQFIRVEEGRAKAILNNGETEHELEDDFAIIIPAGIWHNIINTGSEDLLNSIRSTHRRSTKTARFIRQKRTRKKSILTV